MLSCPGSSVGRALCLESRVSWVRVPPRAAPFSFEKEVVLVGIAMHLPCTLDSCLVIIECMRSRASAGKEVRVHVILSALEMLLTSI